MNDADGTGVTATVTGADSDTTNTVVYYADETNPSKTDGVAITANGSGAIAVATGATYWFFTESEDSSGNQILGANAQRVRVTNDSTGAASGYEDLIRDKGESMSLKRRTISDERGSRTPAWGSSTTVYGWLQPMSSDIRIQYERREIRVNAKIFTASDPSVSEGDRIETSSRNYIIRGVVDQAGDGSLWRLDVEEIR